ncbi:MAG: BREX-4 system phosphatase PglZ, partial [Oscillospiraceae bacterium]
AETSMSKLLSLYMREFSFDSTNTKLSDADAALRAQLTAYFSEYKRQKLTNKIHDGFVEKVESYASERPYNKLKARSKIVAQIDKKDAQLFFFDALGVEYLSFIKAKCEEYGLLCELEIGRCELPSITEKNKEFQQYFPAEDQHKIDALDEIKHHSSVYDYRKCDLPLHLFVELEIIDEELRRIQSMLVQGTLSKALIVSDHGASRLAVRYGHESAASVQLDESGEHSGRCCPAETDPHIPFAAYEDGYSILANYERFKGGRKANVEVHGGATLEEVLVPVITLTKRPENVEFCFTEPVIILIPREIPTLTLYANIPMTKPRLHIDGEFIEGEFVADSRHAKFSLPKLKRKGDYFADVYDGDKDMGVRLPFSAQKNTREVDLF